MIPALVKNFLIEHKEKQGCFCFALDQSLNIVEFFGDPKLLGIDPMTLNTSIFEVIPGVLTERFDADFEIPFYNINSEHVCNIYFLKREKISYIILVDKSEIFQITQKYQQFAHDDNISKNKFKRIAQELEKAKKRLKKSNQEKATLIAMLSHELGTPLTSILGYSELLINNETNSKNALKIINKNAVYLKHLIENTLLFGRSEAGSIQIQLEEVSLQSLFNELKAIILPTANDKNLSLNTSYNSNAKLNIDLTRTKQILINLLNNAVKYTDFGSIELTHHQENNHHVFSIIDTGIGVPLAQQKSIFNPWERVEESTEKGSGIGLFISQQLAQAIGGSLLLKHSDPKKGSIFQLSIPIVEMPIKQQSLKHSEYDICKNKRLLIIDDDEDILELIEALLSETKLSIYTAINFPKAQEILNDSDIDMVLTDLNLGTVKASSYLLKIKSINSATPIILMTAMPSQSHKANYLTQGFDAVVSKPIHRESLIKTILSQLIKQQ